MLLRPKAKLWASTKNLLLAVITFVLILIPWIFFRSKNLEDALIVIRKIVSDPPVLGFTKFYPKRWLLILILLVWEWWQRFSEYPLKLAHTPRWTRFLIYYFVVLSILFLGAFDYNPFIYFQF